MRLGSALGGLPAPHYLTPPPPAPASGGPARPSHDSPPERRPHRPRGRRAAAAGRIAAGVRSQPDPGLGRFVRGHGKTFLLSLLFSPVLDLPFQLIRPPNPPPSCPWVSIAQVSSTNFGVLIFFSGVALSPPFSHTFDRGICSWKVIFSISRFTSIPGLEFCMRLQFARPGGSVLILIKPPHGAITADAIAAVTKDYLFFLGEVGFLHRILGLFA